MTTQRLTALGLRLLGLYILAEFLVRLPQILIFLVHSAHGAAGEAVPSGDVLALILTGVVVKLTLCLWLVFGCRGLARWMAVDPDPEAAALSTDSTDLITGGIALAGLVLLAVSAADLVETLVMWRGYGSAIWIREPQPIDLSARALAQGLKILIGGVMVRQAGWLTSTVRESNLRPGRDCD